MFQHPLRSFNGSLTNPCISVYVIRLIYGASISYYYYIDVAMKTGLAFRLVEFRLQVGQRLGAKTRQTKLL